LFARSLRLRVLSLQAPSQQRRFLWWMSVFIQKNLPHSLSAAFISIAVVFLRRAA
jgi:hypothetical protein